MVQVNLEYNKEVDVLSARNKGQKIKYSKRLGNIVLDFDFNDKVIGCEILNASEVLGGLDVPLEMILSVESATIRNIVAPNSQMVAIIFPLKKPITYLVSIEEEKPITV